MSEVHFEQGQTLALYINQKTFQEWEGSSQWCTPDVWVRCGTPDVHLPWPRDGGQAGGGQVSRDLKHNQHFNVQDIYVK